MSFEVLLHPSSTRYVPLRLSLTYTLTGIRHLAISVFADNPDKLGLITYKQIEAINK